MSEALLKSTAQHGIFYRNLRCRVKKPLYTHHKRQYNKYE